MVKQDGQQPTGSSTDQRDSGTERALIFTRTLCGLTPKHNHMHEEHLLPAVTSCFPGLTAAVATRFKVGSADKVCPYVHTHRDTIISQDITLTHIHFLEIFSHPNVTWNHIFTPNFIIYSKDIRWTVWTDFCPPIMNNTSTNTHISVKHSSGVWLRRLTFTVLNVVHKLTDQQRLIYLSNNNLDVKQQ